jgi:hypothetical protein
MLISALPGFEKRDFAESRRAGAGSAYGRAYVKGSRRTPHPLVADSEVFAS